MSFSLSRSNAFWVGAIVVSIGTALLLLFVLFSGSSAAARDGGWPVYVEARIESRISESGAIGQATLVFEGESWTNWSSETTVDGESNSYFMEVRPDGSVWAGSSDIGLQQIDQLEPGESAFPLASFRPTAFDPRQRLDVPEQDGDPVFVDLPSKASEVAERLDLKEADVRAYEFESPEGRLVFVVDRSTAIPLFVEELGTDGAVVHRLEVIEFDLIPKEAE